MANRKSNFQVLKGFGGIKHGREIGGLQSLSLNGGRRHFYSKRGEMAKVVRRLRNMLRCSNARAL